MPTSEEDEMDEKQVEYLREYTDITELYARRMSELTKTMLDDARKDAEPEEPSKTFDFIARGPMEFTFRGAEPQGRAPISGPEVEPEAVSAPPDPDRDAALLALHVHTLDHGKEACAEALGLELDGVMQLRAERIWDAVKVLDDRWPSETKPESPQAPPAAPETLGEAVGLQEPGTAEKPPQAPPALPTRGQLKRAIVEQLNRLNGAADAWLEKKRGERADEPVASWMQSNGTLRVWLAELEAFPTPKPAPQDDIDCDDMDPAVNPDAGEVAGNGEDDDCDGDKPEDPAELAQLCKAIEAELGEEAILEARGRSGIEEFADLPSLRAPVLRIYRAKLHEALKGAAGGEE